MEFFSLYDQGFARVAGSVVPLALVQPRLNAERIAARVRDLDAQGVAVAAFGELSLVGATAGDLLQHTLLDATVDAIAALRDATASLHPMVVVGAPLRHRNRLYNCAVVLHGGDVLGVVPQSYPDNQTFAPGGDETGFIDLLGCEVAFGPDLLFEARDVPGLVVHVQIGRDSMVPVSPAAVAALAGATVLCTLDASPAEVGRPQRRLAALEAESRRLAGAIVYVSTGQGESSTDLAWDGHAIIADNGEVLAENQRYGRGADPIADVDLDTIRADRLRPSFDADARLGEDAYGLRTVEFDLAPEHRDCGLARPVARFPFVPTNHAELAVDCEEAYRIQVQALRQRLSAIGEPKIVIGVSGGLDSTQALLVAAKAMDAASRPRSDILAFTMPGFATSEHTKNNAIELCEALGVPIETIDITHTARQMLSDMGHPFGLGEEVYDVTFENVQAGLRTDYLFRIANQRGGIVLGTGDLSELALGWCTFGVGDHMSHYGVNGGVPKTLMQHLIRWVIATRQFDDRVDTVLQAILDTEITPELVPTREDEVPQSTEASIGPYALQDFTLYWTLRSGLRPEKIAFLAWHAWRDATQGEWPAHYPADKRVSYGLGEIKRWSQVFFRRFFTNQFKRSTLPNGPRVLPVGTLSPRTDWDMPSDAAAAEWLDAVSRIPEAAPNGAEG